MIFEIRIFSGPRRAARNFGRYSSDQPLYHQLCPTSLRTLLFPNNYDFSSSSANQNIPTDRQRAFAFSSGAL